MQNATAEDAVESNWKFDCCVTPPGLFPFLHINLNTAIYHGNLVKLCNLIVTNGERKSCILGAAKHNKENKKKELTKKKEMALKSSTIM